MEKVFVFVFPLLSTLTSILIGQSGAYGGMKDTRQTERNGEMMQVLLQVLHVKQICWLFRLRRIQFTIISGPLISNQNTLNNSICPVLESDFLQIATHEFSCDKKKRLHT